MRNGKYKIKRYKTGSRKGLVILCVLLIVFAAVIAGVHLIKSRALTLPPFSAPELSPQDMQQETRLITLPGSSFFALQLGVFSDEGGAKAQADAYLSRGAAGFIHPKDGYRVLAAAYENRESAQAVQENLSQKHGVDAYLYPLSRSEMTLRLSGQKAQLDAFEDAYQLCDQLTYTLSTLSQALDQGEMTTDEVIRALSSQRDTVRAIHGRMAALFRQEEHPAVQNLSRLLSETEDHLVRAIQSPNATRLGGNIKYCHVFLLCGLEAFLSALAP